MKKHSLILMAVAAMICAGCSPTRIVTVSPSYSGVHASNTVVTVPRTHTVTSTTHVYSREYDMCLHLDLQAVAAAFAQSSTVREFEMILNSSSYMISNLDLNRDGYIDYLRVVETLDRYAHIFIIQAVVGHNMFQDVATIVVENPSFANCYVEVIGNPYIYGPNYIVRPTYHSIPAIYRHLCKHGYTVWTSPWHWGHYPSYYRRPAPVYLSHYQAYVTTYMHNHHYCHVVTYPSAVHYTNYHTVVVNHSRNDYGNAHPERTFTVRNADIATSNSAVSRAEAAQRVINARDVRSAQEATVSRTNTTTNTSASRSNSSTTSTSRSNASSTSSTASRSNSTATSTSRSNASTTSSPATPSRSGSSSTSTATRSSNSSTPASTTVRSRVNQSGSSDTSTTTTTSSGSSTVRRGTTTTSSSASTSSSSSRSSASTSSASRSSSTNTSSASRSSSSTSSSSASATRRR